MKTSRILFGLSSVAIASGCGLYRMGTSIPEKPSKPGVKLDPQHIDKGLNVNKKKDAYPDYAREAIRNYPW